MLTDKKKLIEIFRINQIPYNIFKNYKKEVTILYGPGCMIYTYFTLSNIVSNHLWLPETRSDFLMIYCTALQPFNMPPKRTKKNITSWATNFKITELKEKGKKNIEIVREVGVGEH